MGAETASLTAMLESADSDAPAISDGSRTIRYGELRRRLDRLCAGLAGVSGSDGGAFAIVSGNPIRHALAVWLAARCGRDVIVLDSERTDIDAILHRVAPSIIFDDQRVAAGRWRVLPAHWLEGSGDTDDPDRSGTAPAAVGSTGWLVASSGTEGPPRIARLGGPAIRAHARASNAETGLAHGDVWLTPISLQHVGGVAVLSRCAAAGACALLHEVFDPARVVAAVMSGRVTHLSLVPAMLAQVLDHASGLRPPAELRCVLIGGAALNPAIAGRALGAGWPLWVAYGMTETVSHITCERIDSDWEAGYVGRALRDVRIAIEGGPDGCGLDRVGRIRIEGPVVMDGYLQPGASVADAGGVFVTGDLGCLDGDGRLRVLGRADDVLISGGVKVHPANVERMLSTCPGVADVGVTAVSDARWGDVLIAVFSGDVDEAGMEKWCRVHVESSKRPRRFRRVDAVPRNAGGKLDRRALARIVRDGTL